MLMTTLSKDMKEQPKWAQKVLDFPDRTYNNSSLNLLRYITQKSYAQTCLFLKKRVLEMVRHSVLMKRKLDLFFFSSD